MRKTLIFAATALLVACDRGGTSTAEIKTAAEQRARQVLRLPADTPLDTTVWVGHEQYEGATVLCGTVSGQGPGSPVTPQRFAATGHPVEWLTFEDAHHPMIATRGEKFPEWARYCGEGEEV